MRFKKFLVIMVCSISVKAQKPDFESSAILYFQDSDYNTSSFTTGVVTKNGMDLMGSFKLPLSHLESQKPSEQNISTSIQSNHRIVAFRKDKKRAYVLETRAALARNGEKASLDDIPAGSYVSVVQTSDPSFIKPEYKFSVAGAPTAMDLDKSNKYLAISSASAGSEVQIYELDDFGKPLRVLPKISNFDSGEVNDVIWHPNNDFLVFIRKEAKELGLIRIVRDKSIIIRLEQFGDVVKFEGNPISGAFSKDGNSFFVLDEGDAEKGEKGKVFQLKLSLDEEGTHALLDKADVEEAPSQLVVHPNGENIVVTNSKKSTSEDSFGVSSLSVLVFKNETLENKLTLPLEGVKPTQVRFDRSGKNMIVGFFQSKDYGKPLSAVTFYKFSGGSNPKVEKQPLGVNLSSGLHHLEVIN